MKTLIMPNPYEWIKENCEDKDMWLQLHDALDVAAECGCLVTKIEICETHAIVYNCVDDDEYRDLVMRGHKDIYLYDKASDQYYSYDENGDQYFIGPTPWM